MRISDWSSDVCSSDLHHDPRLTRLAIAQAHVMAIQHFFAHLMIGALDADGDIAKTVCLECIDGAATDRAKAEDDDLALVAVMSIDAFELQGMQHCAVAGHFVVLVKRVSAPLAEFGRASGRERVCQYV